MAKPLIIDQGQVRQLPTSEPLNVGSWSIPAGSVSANSFFVGVTANSPEWVVIGEDQYLGSDSNGDIGVYDKDWYTQGAFVNVSTGSADAGKPIVLNASGKIDTSMYEASIGDPTAASQVYQSTGAGAGAWTTDISGLTSLQVDSLTLDGDVINSSSGSVNLQNDNLNVFSDSAAYGVQLARYGAHSYAGQFIGIKGRGSIASPTQTLSGDTFVRFSVRGYDDTDSLTTQAGTSDFITVNATEDWTTTAQGRDFRAYIVETGSTVLTEWMRANDSGVHFYMDVAINGCSLMPTADNQIMQATGAGTWAWTTDVQTLTSLQVDNVVVDGNAIYNNTNILYVKSERAAASGTQYGIQEVVDIESTSGLAYCKYETLTGTSADGSQVRGRQTVLYPSSAGNNSWVIGEYLSMQAMGSGTTTSVAAYYVPSVATAGTKYAFYCFNTIAIDSNSAGLLLGASNEALIYDDGTDLRISPNYNDSGQSVIFVACDTVLEASYRHNIGQYAIGEISTNRLMFECNRTDGGGGIYDFYPRPRGTADGTDYNYFYIWSQNYSESDALRFGYWNTGDYKFETLGTTHYDVSFLVGGYAAAKMYTTGRTVFGSDSLSPFSWCQVDIVGDHDSYEYGSQLHLRTASTTYGTHLGGWTDNGIWSTGAVYYSGGQFRTLSNAEATSIWQSQGQIEFYCDTGLSTSANYTPTMVCQMDTGYVYFPSGIEERHETAGTESVHHVFGSSYSSTRNGTMKINLPVTGSSNTMWCIRIMGFNYLNSYNDAEGPWELIIGGYDYSGNDSWYAQGSGVTGNPPFRKVRVAYDSGIPCLLLGKEETVWNYPFLQVMDMVTRTAYNVWGLSGWTVEFSTDESTDWTITNEENCPLSLGPGVQVEDDGDTGVRLLVNSLELTAPETGNTPAITGQDRTIYVATTGNDTTGDGSSGAPYASISRAMLDVKKMVPSGDDADTDYTITVSIAAGHYTVGSAIRPAYAYGSALYFTGVVQDCNASTATSYGSDTSLETGLSYVSVSGVLASGTTASVGDYLVIKEATGGTNPHLVEGCHEITAWNSSTRAYTAKVVRRSSVAALPSGTITLTTAYVSKTVLSFASGNGIYISGGHGGSWDNMTIVGNSSGTGVWAINAGFITLSSYFSTSHWSQNLYAQNNATIFADSTVHSYSAGALVKLQNSAIVNLRYGAVISGARTYGIQCFVGATVAAYTLRASTAGGTAILKSYQGAFIEAASSILKDPYSSAEYADATIGGGVDITSATVSGGATATYTSPGYVVGP